MNESKDQRTGWLADLKQGDKVGVVPRHQRPDHISASVGTVAHVTPTGRIRINMPGGYSAEDFRPDGSQSGRHSCLCPAGEARGLTALTLAQRAALKAAEDLAKAIGEGLGLRGLPAEAARDLATQIEALTEAVREKIGGAS